MIAAVVLVAALVRFGDAREAAAALPDLGEEQAILAESVAAHLAARIDLGAPAEAGARLAPLGALERPDEVALLVRPPAGRLERLDGRAVDDHAIATGLTEGRPFVVLDREDAARLGLPERLAVAGLAHVETKEGRWGVAVVASAARERDRETRATWRAVLGVGVAAALVSAFGGLALRTQRKELELVRELAIADLRREADERLLRASRAAMMGTLAGGVAHEVSTPLGVIAGRAEQLLPRVAEDERARRAVQAILEQTQRIDEVVRGFLGLARGQAPALEEARPAEIAREAASLVEHRFAKGEVSLEVRAAEDLPAIRCDRRLFAQAIVNLLLNACDACRPRGQVALSARADARRVTFEVTDDGAGIRPEDARRATEPFFTTKPEGEGTGLGLAITQEIVRIHRGSLSLSSNEGRGTRALVEIPRAEAIVDAVA